VVQWDFSADLEQLVSLIDQGAGPRTMSSMAQSASSLIQRSRCDDPAGLERWFSENAEVLVAQQLLVANVHKQQSPATELPRVLREWAAHSEDQTPEAAVGWLKEEYPGLLRAWLLSRVADLIADELTRT